MNDKEILYNKVPYDRMRMVDLAYESKEMQWAILDYHNQPFVLNNIVDHTLFTREGHAKFLSRYPDMKRRQYIVYYEDRAIGKISITPLEDGEYNDLGYYLFHENDLHKHLGLLMVSFAYHYFFEEKNAKKIHYTILKMNHNSQRVSLSLGCRIVREDLDLVYVECLREDFQRSVVGVDEKLANIFSNKEV